MLTEDFTIILRLIFVQQHKKNVYQNIKSPFMKRWYQLLYVNRGGGLQPEGPAPEHPAPAFRSGLDSYVSKGGPLGGFGRLRASPWGNLES